MNRSPEEGNDPPGNSEYHHNNPDLDSSLDYLEKALVDDNHHHDWPHHHRRLHPSTYSPSPPNKTTTGESSSNRSRSIGKKQHTPQRTKSPSGLLPSPPHTHEEVVEPLRWKEVDFYRNPTILSRLILHQKYASAIKVRSLYTFLL